MNEINICLDQIVISPPYWELCVLQACAFGAYHVAREQYCARFDDMSIALLREFARVKEMYSSLEPELGAKASE